jgi:hypothetical protein
MLQVLALMAWPLASDIERVYMHASVCPASRALHRLHRLAPHHQLVPCTANARHLATSGILHTALRRIVDFTAPRSHRHCSRCQPPTLPGGTTSLYSSMPDHIIITSRQPALDICRTIRQKHTRPCTRHSFDFDYPVLARRLMRAARTCEFFGMISLFSPERITGTRPRSFPLLIL